jgi:lysyl-tRNA synthetase class 2
MMRERSYSIDKRRTYVKNCPPKQLLPAIFARSVPIVNTLHQRAGVIRRIRQFFDDRQFCEVQTPILSADTVLDRYIDPISVTDTAFPTNHHGTKMYYLQTSPEFAMKRLLVAGMSAIYQITPVFRKGDRGQFHNPEFTMLEWYRCGDDYHGGMNLLTELVQHAAGLPCPVFQSFKHLFVTELDLDPHSATAMQLRNAAEKHGVRYPDSYKTELPDAWLDLLFSELIQPKLGNVIVYDYPVSQSQLAQTRLEDGHEISERFELFLNGLEIANGYHELQDADELQRRFQTCAALRHSDGKEPLPLESRLLEAMQSGLPPCSGTALGIERFLMVLLHAEHIGEVMTFPIETA